MDINNFLNKKIKEDLKDDIEDAAEREIFLVGKIDNDSGKIVDYNLLARGNSHMVPAITRELNPGQVVIHNHPSGDLSPSGRDINIASRLGEKGIGFAIIDNLVENVYIVVEPRQPRKITVLDEEEITTLFKPGNSLADNLKDYEYRREQIEVTEEVIRSFNGCQTSLIEAGTGIGKSLAYLIPAVYWSHKNERQVVISTNTINLQEQLINKDLVLLRKILPFSFKEVLVKGRGNYVCLRKIKNLAGRYGDIFAGEPELKNEFAKVLDWVDRSDSGTRSDINFRISAGLWEKIASETDLCLKSHCPYFNSCFFVGARKEVFSADILIVNNHLLLSDARLKRENGAILPKYRHLIVDEAHNFNDTATRQLGYPFYYKMVNRFLQRLNDTRYSTVNAIRNKLGNFKMNKKQEIYRLIDENILPQIPRIRETTKEYFNRLQQLLAGDEQNVRITEKLREKSQWGEIMTAAEKLTGYLQGLGINLNKIYELMLQEGETVAEKFSERLLELEAAVNRTNRIIETVEFNTFCEDNNYIFWLEKEKGQIRQNNAPLDVSSLLDDLLWQGLENKVFTSATMTVNGEFKFIKDSLGLQNPGELKIDSPFNYHKQARVLVPEDIPEANTPEFISEIKEEMGKILINTGGSTMILFTSYRMLNECRRLLEDDLNKAGINILAQGKYSRSYIIKTFKKNSSQVIFGTVSFWEGVDIRGDNLKHLIIMKLPFAVPDEPVAEARREKIKTEGKNPFYNYSLPRAVLRFRQGFGRLIRSRSDKGVIIIMDNRILTKSYGRAFLNSLPPDCPVEKEKLENIHSEVVKQ